MFIENSLGHIFQHDSLHVFFGKKSASLDHLKKEHSSLQFCTLHQFHSDICVPAKPGAEQSADAHFTFDRNLALVIKTADCVPIFMYCPTTDTILGIHAGWRGLQSEIIRNSISKSFPYSNKQKIQVWVGPFIATENYQFSTTDIDLLRNVSPPTYYKEVEGKYFLNLKSIVEYQLQQNGLDLSQCHFLNIDTYSSKEHFSYREGKEKDHRLYHFIVNRRG